MYDKVSATVDIIKSQLESLEYVNDQYKMLRLYCDKLYDMSNNFRIYMHDHGYVFCPYCDKYYHKKDLTKRFFKRLEDDKKVLYKETICQKCKSVLILEEINNGK